MSLLRLWYICIVSSLCPYSISILLCTCVKICLEIAKTRIMHKIHFHLPIKIRLAVGSNGRSSGAVSGTSAIKHGMGW